MFLKDLNRNISVISNDINIANGKYEEKIYGSMEELGASNDFGFCLKDVWEKIEFPLIKPDFDEFGLQVILDAYKAAWNKRRRRK